MVGFDDDFGDAVRSVRFSARLAADGDVQVGGTGVGSWTLRLAGEQIEFELQAVAGGMGDTMLAPPAETRVVGVSSGDVLEATVARRIVDEPEQPARGGRAVLA